MFHSPISHVSSFFLPVKLHSIMTQKVNLHESFYHKTEL